MRGFAKPLWHVSDPAESGDGLTILAQSRIAQPLADAIVQDQFRRDSATELAGRAELRLCYFQLRVRGFGRAAPGREGSSRTARLVH